MTAFREFYDAAPWLSEYSDVLWRIEENSFICRNTITLEYLLFAIDGWHRLSYATFSSLLREMKIEEDEAQANNGYRFYIYPKHKEVLPSCLDSYFKEKNHK